LYGNRNGSLELANATEAVTIANIVAANVAYRVIDIPLEVSVWRDPTRVSLVRSRSARCLVVKDGALQASLAHAAKSGQAIPVFAVKWVTTVPSNAATSATATRRCSRRCCSRGSTVHPSCTEW